MSTLSDELYKDRGKDSQLQPDISLVKMDTEADDMIEAYGHGSNPSTKDTLSAIEICKTTQRRDREEKLPRYAQSGVPEVFILDIDEKKINAYRAPVDDRYTEVVEDVKEIRPQQLPGLDALALTDILLKKPEK